MCMVEVNDVQENKILIILLKKSKEYFTVKGIKKMNRTSVFVLIMLALSSHVFIHNIK